MTPDWIELPDFPRTFASSCAPWTSSVRLVHGERAVKAGKSVTLSPTKTFVQSLEIALIRGHAANSDVATLVNDVLAANARHIDLVEWARLRGDELDLSLRVYGSRGSHRLHLSLRGPIGRYADEPPPARAAPRPPQTRPTRAKPPPATAPAPELPPRRDPPRTPVISRPIAADTAPTYGDVIALDRDGLLHAALRLPDAYAYARVEPSGAPTITRLPTRDELRAEDPATMTAALMPELHATTAGLVRLEHHETSSGMQERVGHAGRWHAGRRGLFDDCHTLGIYNDWLLRCIRHGKKATLVGVHLGSGKRTRLALPAELELRGAAIVPTTDGELLLRLQSGLTDELRLRLRVGATLTIDPTTLTRVTHGLPGLAQPVPHSDGWVVASDRSLRLVRPDGTDHALFTLPPTYSAAGYGPWGWPRVTQIGLDPPSWQVALDFGSDHGPRCTGTLLFTADGAVRGRAHLDADGSLHSGATQVVLTAEDRVLGHAAGPAGDIATLLAGPAGVSLVWTPPV